MQIEHVFFNVWQALSYEDFSLRFTVMITEVITRLASWHIQVSRWFRNGIYQIHQLLAGFSATINCEAWCLNG